MIRLLLSVSLAITGCATDSANKVAQLFSVDTSAIKSDNSNFVDDDTVTLSWIFDYIFCAQSNIVFEIHSTDDILKDFTHLTETTNTYINLPKTNVSQFYKVRAKKLSSGITSEWALTD